MTVIDELRVLISGDNRGLKRAVDESDRSLNRFEETTGRVGRGGGFAQAATMADRMGGAINRAMGIMTRLDLVQITLEQSAERVRQAQEKYTAAVEEFGQHSTKAVEAQRQLEAAQAAGEKANIRARASYILVSAEVVSMGAMAVRAASGMGVFAGSMVGATVAARGLRLALLGTGIGALVVGLGFLLERMNSVRDTTSDLVSRNQAAEDSEKRVAAAIDEGSVAIRDQIAEREANLALLNRQMRDQENFLKQIQARDARGENDLPLVGLKFTPDQDMEGGQVSFQVLPDVGTVEAELKRLTEEFGATDEAVKKLKASLESVTFDEIARALGSAGVGLADFTVAQQALILGSEGLDELGPRYVEALNREDEMLARIIANNPEIINRMSIVLRYGETLDELAGRLKFQPELEAELRASGQLTTEGLITQADAMERAGKASEKAADEMARLQEEQERVNFQNLQNALSGAGVDLDNMTTDMQRLIFAADGMSGVENSFILLQQAEESLLQSALDVVPALLEQISVQRKKGETNQMLAARLGLTVEQEKELLAQGRLTVDGIITEQEKLRRFGIRESDRFRTGANAIPMPAPRAIFAADGFNGIVREPTDFVAGERGPERVNIEPLSRDAGRGGGTTINVVVQRVEVPVSMAPARFDPEETANAVQESLTEQLRRLIR